jgi:hypothetical protein
MQQLFRFGGRVFFGAALVLAGLAAWEKLANVTGRTLVFIGNSSPSHLLDLASVALLFVIAIQLHEIKALWRAPGGSAPM